MYKLQAVKIPDGWTWQILNEDGDVWRNSKNSFQTSKIALKYGRRACDRYKVDFKVIKEDVGNPAPRLLF